MKVTIFQQSKNTLCDWCYYKPICPEFNKNVPSTVELENCNEKIDEINETLEAINLVGGLDNLPDNSPLKNTNLDEINKNLEELNITKNKIVKDIEEFLRK